MSNEGKQRWWFATIACEQHQHPHQQLGSARIPPKTERLFSELRYTHEQVNKVCNAFLPVGSPNRGG